MGGDESKALYSCDIRLYKIVLTLERTFLVIKIIFWNNKIHHNFTGLTNKLKQSELHSHSFWISNNTRIHMDKGDCKRPNGLNMVAPENHFCCLPSSAIYLSISI